MKASEIKDRQLKLDMQVYSLDGKAGKVSKIIIDPANHQPSYLVVKTGKLRGRLIVVPVSMVRDVTPDSVVLNLRREALSDFPDYEVKMRIGHYQRPIPIGSPRSISIYTPKSNRDYLVLRQRNIPERSVEVKKGIKVLDLFGEGAGEVEGIIVSQEERKGKYIVLRNAQNSIQQLIPIDLVEDIKSDSIQLSIAGEYISGLPALVDESAE